MHRISYTMTGMNNSPSLYPSFSPLPPPSLSLLPLSLPPSLPLPPSPHELLSLSLLDTQGG